MRHMMPIACALFVATRAAGAQKSGMVTGTLKCAKPNPSYSIPVANVTGHALALHTMRCTWSNASSIGGNELQAEDDTFTSDMMPDVAHDRGYGVGSVAGGAGTFSGFEGTTTITNNMPSGNTCTWTFTGGTGKLKGLTGSGTCKGAFAPDGTSSFTMNGNYQLP